jgi:hypothetical protein
MPKLGLVIDVTSFKYPIAIKRWQGYIDQRVISVFIAVISATDNFVKRMEIRQTWKNHIDEVRKFQRCNIQFSFILGQSRSFFTQRKIQEESKTQGDIIQMEMLDFYRNLPLKMTGLFNWINSNCPKIDFVLKVDDDMYVNVHIRQNDYFWSE